jgi:nitrite reductase/ring-hydroxylating ferredoxin subunit/uncharacterized membrane protein
MAQPAAAPQTWNAGEPERPVLHDLVERLGTVDVFDDLGEQIAKKVAAILGKGAIKDGLAGTWLGHALHPLLTDIPIGTWTSAVVLDLIGGRGSQDAADRLIAVGLAAAGPTAVSGWSEYSDSAILDDSVKRGGRGHAAANIAAISLYGASLLARRTGRRGRGRALAVAGAGALAVGGHLGGHLTYAQGVGVDQTSFDAPPREWTRALADADLPEGQSRKAWVEGVEVFLTRRDGRVYALAEHCCHRGGPLSDGSVENGCVECPWHGSLFRLTDGSVMRGPAAMPQPAYDARVTGGAIEVRARARSTL